MAKPSIITGLDIGTSCVKILVALKNPDSSKLEVLGISQGPLLGVRRGVVVNIDEVSKKISDLVREVQGSVEQKIDSVYTNIGGSHISVVPSQGAVAVSRADQRISQEDKERVIQSAQTFSLPFNKEILEVFPQEFIVDGEGGIKDVLGLKGVRLEVKILALCAFSPYLDNLTNAVLNSGLQIEGIICSPIASSRAVLTPQQKELGVAVIDIGAGTTSLAVFEEGNLIHSAVFPIGSLNITNDIAIGLKCDIDTAERIKREFGSCILPKKNDKNSLPKAGKKIKVVGAGQEELVFSQKFLIEIIEARISEIFGLINKELKKIFRENLLPAGIVLTGGGSKLPKITELAKKELKLPCRIGVPQGFLGLEEDTALSSVCGLVLHGADLEEDIYKHSSFGKGIFNRLKKIFRVFVP